MEVCKSDVRGRPFSQIQSHIQAKDGFQFLYIDGNTVTIMYVGTVNYPEVVQDNTESPTEDETALTEVFETSVRKMDREQRNKSQLPQVNFYIATFISLST